MNVEPGTVVDRYTFEGPVGSGGMAVVYLARHNALGSRHAIKVLTLPSQAIQARLLQEGRAQSQVTHPNIVTVTDVIEVAGAPGLVMEYIAGPSLHQLLKHERLELEQSDRLVRGILRGVAAAHRAGLVHRDLKPGNILLAPWDSGLMPKITDFGLAKVLSPGAAGAFQTRSGMPMGTPSYMAPEQIRDAANVDARADIWALGCILYEMSTNRRAFLGADVVDTYRLVSEGRYRPPRELAPDLPDRMVHAIEGCLQLDPAQRFSDVATLLEAWRGGVDVSEAGTLDPGLVQRARALVSEPAPSVLSGPSWTGGRSEETWAEAGLGLSRTSAESLHSEVATAARPEPAPRSWVRWVAVGSLVMGLAAGTLWWVIPEPPAANQVFSVVAAPVVLADPLLQGELEAAWRALLDVDLEQCERRIALVVDANPDDPSPWLIYSRVLHYGGRSGESINAIWEAVRAAEGKEGPRAELARLLGALRSDGWQAHERAALAFLAAHPDDYLAHLVLGGMVPPTDRERVVAVTTHMVSLDRDVALSWWLQARWDQYFEDFDAAERALRAGLDANPRTPTLLASLGDVLLQEGQFEEGRDALLQAVDLAPGDALARTRLAAAWLMLGDDASVERTTRQMMAPPTRWAHQARYAQDLADVYVGLGRLEEAVALVREAGRAAKHQGEWTTAVVLYGKVAVIYMDAEMVLPMVDASEALMELSHQPELPDTERETLVRNLLYARGIGAVRTGKLVEAEEILERLRGVDRVWPVFIEWLDREIAIAKHQPERVLDRVGSISEGCVGDLEKANALYRAGGHPSLAALLDRRLGDPTGCSQLGTPRFMQAGARVTRAELAYEAGDLDLARAHLDALDALWSRPDRNVPVAERARSLRVRIH